MARLLRSRYGSEPEIDMATGRARVREWQSVTVAWALMSMDAIGRPRMGLRPITTARTPSSTSQRSYAFPSSSPMVPLKALS